MQVFNAEQDSKLAGYLKHAAEIVVKLYVKGDIMVHNYCV